MNFLYPGFLFALLSVAIPVIIHLFNFRKFKKVYFSNVQLLKEVEQQNSSKEKVKNLLILASRILAIIGLVLAFAQPYIPLNHQKNTLQNNAVSIYIDNSYSMETVNKDGSLLDEAKRRAIDLVKNYGVNDRFQMLTNDFEGKHQRLLSKEEFLKALDDVKISATSRNLQQILDRQANVFTGSANKYAFLLSDFQKNSLSGPKLETKPDINYSFLKLNAVALANVAVDSVWMLSPNHQPNADERIVVKLRNYSDEPAVNVPVKLSINNQQKGLGSITLPAGKTVQDTMNFSGLKPGWQKGMVTIKDFPIVFDDTLSFSFKVDQSFPVLSIKGDGAGNYIRALFGADAYYKLTENPERNINYSNFSQYGLIVLDGLKEPSTGLAQQLKTYITAGGTVVIFPDLDANISNYNTFLRALSLPQIQELNKVPVRVDKIDLQHPLFKTVFEEVPKNLDLPMASRHFTFVENNNSNKENLMQFADGKLFFGQYRVGNGQIYLSASGLNPGDGNLSRHPVFVPLMYRLAMSSGAQEQLYYTLGNDQVLTGKKINMGKNQSLKLIANRFEAIPEVRQLNGKTIIYTADQIRTPGFYNLQLADSLLAVYSFNPGRAESDMHYLSVADLNSVSGQPNLRIFDADKDALKIKAGANEIGKTLWKLCLILSLIFIAAEILLIRFFNNTKKTI